MVRVASLYLPQLAIERLRRLEPTRSQPELRTPASLPVDDEPGACSVPRGGGWRPGARWARALGGAPSSPGAASVDRKPMILAELVGQRELVSAACPAARGLGLFPGMPVAQARALVADLDVRPAEREDDANWLNRLAVHAARFWDPVSAVSRDDGIWVEIGRSAHLHGGEEAFCRKAATFLRRLGFTARIAVADTAGAAHALARFGREAIIIVPPGHALTAVAALPIEALRLAPEAVDAARKFGLERIADLLPLPRGPLARRLGRDAILRLDQAIGREPEPIAPALGENAPTAELRLLEPISTPEAIEQVIKDAVDMLACTLRARGLGVRALRLDLLRVDGEEQRVAIGTSRATREPPHLASLFKLKMDKIDPGLGIEAVRLTATLTEKLGAIALGSSLVPDERSADMAPLVDQIVGRVGEASVFRLAPVESDVPERAVRRTGPLETVPGWPGWRRPARLLDRPQPISHVASLLPDGAPRRFRWHGRMHDIVAADGPERIHGEWWVRAGETWGIRDYYHVEDSEGGHYWLFRRGDGIDPATGDLSWWLHGVG